MYVLHENSNQFCDEYKVDWKKKERKERYNPTLRRGEKHNSWVEVGCLTRWKSKEGNGDAISRKRVHKFNLAGQVL